MKYGRENRGVNKYDMAIRRRRRMRSKTGVLNG
jgi:hypothetical protein